MLQKKDHKNGNNNHIITPRDGKALQFGCLGSFAWVFKARSTPGKTLRERWVAAMSICSLCLLIGWALALRAGAHAIVKHDEGIDIAATSPGTSLREKK